MSLILVIVPCGSAKIWKSWPHSGPTSAKHAYTGGPFKVKREYAEKFSDRWVILSAKYGFIDPDFTIPADYNVTFNDPSTRPISVSELRRQVIKKRLGRFDVVVALGSGAYAAIVKQALAESGTRILAPAAGLPIGMAMGTVRKAIDTNRPFSANVPRRA